MSKIAVENSRGQAVEITVLTRPQTGCETVIPYNEFKIEFNVSLESTRIESFCTTHFEVEVWCNYKNENQWEGLRLHNDRYCSRRQRRWYERTVFGTYQRPICFTFRFRRNGVSNWVWLRDQTGTKDGKVIYQTGASYSPRLQDYLADPDHELRISSARSQAIDTALWNVYLMVPSSYVRDRPGVAQVCLGRPKSVLKWFSLVRHSAAWLGPRHGDSLSHGLDRESLLWSFLRSDGLHVVCLAITYAGGVTTLISCHRGAIYVAARNDQRHTSRADILVAVGRTFDTALAATIYQARDLVSERSIPRVLPSPDLPKQILEQQWNSEWTDGLTYCTWTSFGQNITEGDIMTALQILNLAGVEVSNLIIDDGWQSLDKKGQTNFARGLKSFEADPVSFPRGLKETILRIRRHFPNIKRIAVWHTLIGYWGGISPGSTFINRYKTRTVPTVAESLTDGQDLLIIDAQDISRFYDDFYTFLTACGVDFVKADGQFILDDLAKSSDRRELTQTYLDAWKTAQQHHFDGRAISCMSQTPSNIFHNQLLSTARPLVVRNSDDYFPTPEAAHPWHIFCNAHNALLTSYLAVIPDWDMFETGGVWGWCHLVARCLSGGPISITDKPSEHDQNGIHRVLADTPQGRTTLLRPSVPGRSSNIYHSYTVPYLLRIVAYNGDVDGARHLGLFNTGSQSQTELITLTDFMGIDEALGRNFVVRRFDTGALFPANRPNRRMITVSLDPRQCAVLTATPIQTVIVESHHGIVHFESSNLGLLKHVLGANAILSSSSTIVPDVPTSTTADRPLKKHKSDMFIPRLQINTTLKALGKLGIYLSSPSMNALSLENDVLVLLNNAVVPMEYVTLTRLPQATNIMNQEAVRLTINMLSAWRDLGLNAGYRDEANVRIFVTLRSSLQKWTSGLWY